MKITTSLLKPCSDSPGWWALTRLSLCTHPHLVPCQIALAFPINIFTARMIIWRNWEIRVFPWSPILDVQMWGYVEVTCGLWEGQELPRRSCLPTPEQFFHWNICQTAEFNCFGIFSNLSFSCRRLPAPSLVAPIYLQHNSLFSFIFYHEWKWKQFSSTGEDVHRPLVGFSWQKTGHQCCPQFFYF